MAAEILGLRTWRERKGVTLETIAASTKLSITQLAAIESGDFGKLPGGIYTTSYLRQYARAIEFDEGELLDFHREFFLGKPALEPRPPASELRSALRRSVAGASGLLRMP